MLFLRLVRPFAVRPLLVSRYCSGKKEDPTQSETSQKTNATGEANKLIVRSSPFESANKKDKQTYVEMVKIFENRSVHRRNHVEFIYTALKHMEEFGVHKDIAVYKALIDVMPKGKFIPTNIFQAEFMHYPKQQQCIIDLLEQMEDNGVMPDYEMEAMLINIFGKKGHPVRKYWRMMYWMPKFKNLSPWPVPNPPPDDSRDLARLAVERMCTVDLQSKVTEYDTSTVENAVDNTWIVSGQSPEQVSLLEAHDKSKPVYIMGPSLIWLRNKSINYFVLMSDPVPEEAPKEVNDTDDVRKIRIPFLGIGLTHSTEIKTVEKAKESVHSMSDGTVYAICCTGTSSKDSLLSWIRLLEKNDNPCLANLVVLFKMISVSSKEVAMPEQDTNVVP